MIDHLFTASSVLWLGILTSISPCPLATNIAAVSFIARDAENPGRVLLGGGLYAFGRSLTYVVLGVLLVLSLVSAPYVSEFLQKYMNKILGPVLILVGMFLLDLIQISWAGFGVGRKLEKQARALGIWGAGLLGIGFALSFCPLSAALFFGTLLPLSVQNNSAVLLPSIYGIGTALPVVLFAVIIAVSAHSLGQMFTRITHVERWTRRITGTVFVGVGIYFSLAYIFEVIEA